MDPRDFPETADIHTSTDEYAGRFRGASGAWMLSTQLRLTRKLLAPYPVTEMLDVGGGHGQLANPLSEASWKVTVLGSDESCAHRIQGNIDAGRIRFQVANLIDLPFPDKSFDVVLCFRLLTHCERYPTLVKELCRVARKAVVVDYPTGESVNAIAPMFFGAKKKFEKNTRTWRLFRHAEVRELFAANGFKRSAIKKQFFFPMVVHRMLKAKVASAAAEGVARALGLTAWLGSPAIARFVPDEKA